MSTTESKGVSTKIFVGCVVSQEIQIHLDSSDLWKQEKYSNEENGLKMIDFNERQYFGMLIDSSQASMTELENTQISIEEGLRKYCPDLVSSINLIAFPQVYLS
jgi:hypothetical protein